jgi:hypothetical protein
MKVLAWIPIAMIIGFLIGFGIPIGLDLLPLLAVASIAAGYLLLTNSHILEG